MIVLKFGGSSLATAENCKKVKDILEKKSEPYIMVVSAMADTTDRLQEIARSVSQGSHEESIAALKNEHLKRTEDLLKPQEQESVKQKTEGIFAEIKTICQGISYLKECSEKTTARILGYGEKLSALLIQAFLHQEGIDLQYLDSAKLIRANNNYLNAEVDFEETNRLITGSLTPGKSYIAPGFIASNEKGEEVVLGRGGSDYTAAIYAAATQSEYLELWSVVSGMLNASPEHVKQAGTIEQLSYKEAFELAYFGAKVLYPPTIRPVMKKDIPVYLKNTLDPENKGSLISNRSSEETDKIKGISSLPGISIVTVSGVGLAGTKGIARRVFQSLEEAGVNVILITQACSEQSICLGIHQQDIEKTSQALNAEFRKEIARHLINPAEVSNEHAIIAVVGDNMRHQVGLSGKIFGALGENAINVIAIAQGASERNISIVVDKKNETKAINVIHERFFRKAIRKIHLFVAGTGNVGSEFLRLVYRQAPLLYSEHQLDLKISGVANSRKMMFSAEGLSPENIQGITDQGRDCSSFAEFVEIAKGMNLRNSIFIDNTASALVSEQYASFLEKSISVVTCNKIASSSPFVNYQKLKQLSRENNCHFQYETCVGAALPIIKTIRDLLLSGDRIEKIQAVLSGSLNFIFNHYTAEQDFANVVLQAKNEGFTEPDPRIDLSGLDVMRKILILAREAGYPKELNEVRFEGFVPDHCLQNEKLEAFLESLRKEEKHFSTLYRQAQAGGKRLKVMAVFEKGEALVSLKETAPDSPFYNLGGKDNIVALYTKRYPDEPLIVKGAGAGAEVTASGVFSDLMYIINR